MSISRKHSNQRMSRIVIHNETIYLCGQVADDREAGITIQTEQTLAKIDQLLAEADSDKEHLLSVTIYLKNMQDFAEMNVAWEQWINGFAPPARACVRAEMASPQLLVEMSVIAAVK